MASRGGLDKAMRVNAAARGGGFTLAVHGDGLPKFAWAVRQVGEKNAHKAFGRALNHTGRKAHTAVVKAAAKQVGLTQKRLKELGNVKFIPATNRGVVPQAKIVSEGRYIPLKEFKPTQFRDGVKAKPWGKRELFKGAFINTGHFRSGNRFPSQHVMRNSGKLNPNSDRNNLPLPMWGPAIPKELVKNESAKAFRDTAGDLSDRVRHEIAVLTKGIVS